jgi:hypothetical protein
MLYQFPNHFEFSEDMLVLIADALHSCQFGTFLGNTEKERKVNMSNMLAEFIYVTMP